MLVKFKAVLKATSVLSLFFFKLQAVTSANEIFQITIVFKSEINLYFPFYPLPAKKKKKSRFTALSHLTVFADPTFSKF